MTKKFRLLISGSVSGQENMALDEAIFLQNIDGNNPQSTLRIYTWQSPCVTIGYFQNHSSFAGYNAPVIRRLTGGLGVSHHKDVSYSFVTSEPDWPSIYDQEQTYHMIHSGIRSGLKILGMEPEFCTGASAPSSLCVQTFFPYDLHIKGKKIVGSSQRRRGKNLMVQGAIHITESSFEIAARAIASGFEKELDIAFETCNPEEQELILKESLLNSKYNSKQWNEKF